MIKLILNWFYPFKSKRKITRQWLYNTFVSTDLYFASNGQVREELAELKNISRQLASKHKMKVLHGVLLTNKEYKEATNAMQSPNNGR